MSQLARPSCLLQAIRKRHHVTFSSCFSQSVCRRRSAGTRLHNHSRRLASDQAWGGPCVNPGPVLSVRAVSSSMIRGAPRLICWSEDTLVKLASSSSTGETLHHPAQAACADVTRSRSRTASPSCRTPDPATAGFDSVKLRSWAFSVDLFGRLTARTSGSSVRIAPLNPHDHPDADRAFVHLLQLRRARGRDDESGAPQAAALAGGEESVLRCDVRYRDGEVRLTAVDAALDGEMGSVPKEDLDFLWLVQVPMSYDVDAVTTGLGSVFIEELENQTCKVQTEEGNIVTQKLKSDTVDLRSSAGNITCVKLLQGNISIATGSHGTITTDRLQGQEMSLQSHSGDVVVKDVYARTSRIESESGDIHLGNLHGDVTVMCDKGDLNIGSLDGSLSASIKEGNAAAYLSKHKDVDISCQQGDISIKVTSDIQTRLDLQAAREIDIPEELEGVFVPDPVEGSREETVKTIQGHLNGDLKCTLTAKAEQGSITLGVQSWLDSLNLRK